MAWCATLARMHRATQKNVRAKHFLSPLLQPLPVFLSSHFQSSSHHFPLPHSGASLIIVGLKRKTFRVSHSGFSETDVESLAVV